MSVRDELMQKVDELVVDNRKIDSFLLIVKFAKEEDRENRNMVNMYCEEAQQMDGSLGLLNFGRIMAEETIREDFE